MKKTSTTKLLRQVEGKAYISDIFHKKTNNKTLDAKSDPNNWPDSWKKIHFKTYPRLEKIPLQVLELDDVNTIILKRRSIRHFTGKPITIGQLSYLLHSSCGLIHLDGDFDNTRRPYPSAGARYPLEVYPIILSVEGLEKGLYHYNVRDSVLELLLEKDLSSWISDVFGKQDWMLQSSVVFIITGVLDRSRIKYRDRGYRFSLIEAGHLGQNICLFAAKIGLGTCPLSGYVDEEVDNLLDIQHTKEVTLYTVVLGNI